MATSFEIVNRIDVVLSLVALGLLVYLLFVYVRLYRQLRQRFTLGFIVFTLLLLFNNLPGTFFHLRRAIGPDERRRIIGGRPPPDLGFDAGGEGFVYLRLIPTAFELVAIGVLVWLSRE